MVAAIYTRQTYGLAAPLAAFAYLLGRGQRRDALTLATVVGGTGPALLGALTAVTGGGFFFHTVIANVNEFRWELVTFYLSDLLGFMPLMVACGAAVLVLAFRSRMASRWFVGPYLLGAFAAALLVGKVGSDVNYLLELCAALALATGILLARYARRPGTRAALMLALALQVAIMAQASQSVYMGFRDSTVDRRSEISRLEKIIEDSDGPVLADEAMGLIPLGGRRIQLQPFEMTQLAREDKWNQRPLLRSIEREEFSAVLIFEPPGAEFLVEDRWTDEMLDRIKTHYEPQDTLAFTTVYRPRE